MQVSERVETICTCVLPIPVAHVQSACPTSPPNKIGGSRCPCSGPLYVLVGCTVATSQVVRLRLAGAGSDVEKAGLFLDVIIETVCVYMCDATPGQALDLGRYQDMDRLTVYCTCEILNNTL